MSTASRPELDQYVALPLVQSVYDTRLARSPVTEAYKHSQGFSMAPVRTLRRSPSVRNPAVLNVTLTL